MRLSQRGQGPATWGGVNKTAVGAREGRYRVTDTSGEDESGWTLKAIGHKRHNAARNERQERVPQQGRLQRHRGGRQRCSSTARCARAAFVFIGVNELGVRR